MIREYGAFLGPKDVDPLASNKNETDKAASH